MKTVFLFLVLFCVQNIFAAAADDEDIKIRRSTRKRNAAAPSETLDKPHKTVKKKKKVEPITFKPKLTFVQQAQTFGLPEDDAVDEGKCGDVCA